MVSLKLIIVLAIGTVCMWIPILAQMRQYKIAAWKSFPVAVLLTITGTVGTYIWYFLENLGVGRSFYGAVFLVPLFFYLIAKVVRINYGDIMDFCAPAECVMLAIMKVQCLVDGCCGGRNLLVTENGVRIVFPSQIVEMINAILIFVLLIVLSKYMRNRRKIYPWYMIIYGASRFVLNFFRASAETAFLGMSIGSVWSLCAIVIGCVCFALINKKNESV